MHDRKKLIDALVAAGMTEEEAQQALNLPDEPEPTEPEPDEPEPDEPEPDEPEPTEPAPDLTAENAQLRASLLSALLRSGGLAAGVKPERLGALVKLADVSAVDPLSEDAAEQVNAAVAAALEEVPELAPANPAAIPGALGQHPRNTGKSLSAFERGLLG